ncbi:MAG: biosynthetic-type acetolactate synthase large subunit [Muribaculaceae bacterium]|nr:biosynthetic-type acetolactate synthase large subunit [Muribaculaceae bacterium]
MKISGAEGLIKSLICEGVDTVFGYPGGQIIAVYDKLYDYQKEIKHILVRHEQGAIHAAQGYARSTGKVGVVIVTSGPGAANVVTGLGDALMDSTPLVVITGQVASAFLGTDAFQETDVVAITQQLTKWAVQIRRPEDIPSMVARAFYIASSGRPGPVVLDIAKDAQAGFAEWSHRSCNFIRSYNPHPEIPVSDITEIADMLNNAERPMILAGHGVTIANAEQTLMCVAEKGNIPVATTLLGRSNLPFNHPMHKGMLGMHGNLGPNIATNKADVILAVGMRFDDRITGDVKQYAPDAKIIHVDIDPSELNKIVHAYKAIHGDAGQLLTALLPLMKHRDRDEWLKLFKKCEEIEHREVIDPELHPNKQKMNMGEVISIVSEHAPENSICVTDVGQNQMFAARYFGCRSHRAFISSGGLGTMGFGLPAAIGAKIGAPRREVILFVGDGGLQMTIQELGTIMAYDVNVKIVLLNNSFLGNVRQWQELFFQGRYSQTEMTNPDFVRLASAYGIAGENVTVREELEGAINRMFDHKGAYLLNISIDADDMIFPMVPAGGSINTIILNPTTKLSL